MKQLIGIIVLFWGSVFGLCGQESHDLLQLGFVWNGQADEKGAYTVFRKTFLMENPEEAVVNIFADARYVLWINGKEVLRGPSRFDPKSPQYDVMDVSKYLLMGKNAIAVLVMEHGSNGKMMNHTPGLTLLLETNDKGLLKQIRTDQSWVCNNRTRYLPAYQTWGFVCDRIDARLDDGDWTSIEYDDSLWKQSVLIQGNQWGKLIPRQIPLMQEWTVPVHPLNGQTLPYILKSGKSILFESARMVQGYASFDFEANDGDSLIFEVGYTTDSNTITTKYRTSNSYIAKKGRQQYVNTESYGFRYIKITSRNNSVKLLNVRVTDRRYPYVEAGQFECNDAFLNELWKRSSLTIRLNSEDGYMDCALREKAEWMGDAAVVEYPVSRVMLGCAADGNPVKSDAGLMKNMIRHIAQSQTDSGTLKAHHPSDRWDIHAYIEDYSCLWVMSLRQVYEYTGDKLLLEEVWEPLKKQMQWFLNHRSLKTGLLYGREFVIFDNPLAYIQCEGATLNAFLYKALQDAAFLAKALSDKATEKLYRQAAIDLFKNFNTHLWIADKQVYSSGISNGKQLLPTVHASMLSLYMGIVPGDRKAMVERHFLQNYANSGYRTKIKAKNLLLEDAFDTNSKVNSATMPYTAFWLLSNLYSMDKDTLALVYIREKWASSLQIEQTGTLTEGFGTGDLCHNFGASAAYFLASNVLGVSTSLPMKNKEVLIKPQFGELQWARGAVVTEHGVVRVSWERNAKRVKLHVILPKGVRANVRIPKDYHKQIKIEYDK